MLSSSVLLVSSVRFEPATLCSRYEPPVDRGLYYQVRSKTGKWSDQREFYVVENCNSYPTLIEVNPREWLDCRECALPRGKGISVRERIRLGSMGKEAIGW